MSKQFKVGDLVRVKSRRTSPFYYDVPFGQVVRVIRLRRSLLGFPCVDVEVVDPNPPEHYPQGTTYTQIIPSSQCKLAKQAMRKRKE